MVSFSFGHSIAHRGFNGSILQKLAEKACANHSFNTATSNDILNDLDVCMHILYVMDPRF